MPSFPKKIFDEFKQTTVISSLIISQWNEKWDNLTYKEKNTANWDEIPLEERLNLIKLDCAAINELSYIKNLNIISTPYVLNFRNITKKKKDSIKLCIYFHADKQFDITICSDIGKCPVSYGKVKNKTKINTWKTQLNQIRDLYQ